MHSIQNLQKCIDYLSILIVNGKSGEPCGSIQNLSNGDKNKITPNRSTEPEATPDVDFNVTIDRNLEILENGQEIPAESEKLEEKSEIGKDHLEIPECRLGCVPELLEDSPVILEGNLKALDNKPEIPQGTLEIKPEILEDRPEMPADKTEMLGENKEIPTKLENKSDETNKQEIQKSEIPEDMLKIPEPEILENGPDILAEKPIQLQDEPEVPENNPEIPVNLELGDVPDLVEYFDSMSQSEDEEFNDPIQGQA